MAEIWPLTFVGNLHENAENCAYFEPNNSNAPTCTFFHLFLCKLKIKYE